MIQINFRKLLPFLTPIIFLYIIISLGWKTSINTFINVVILIVMMLILSFFHFFILFEKKLDKGYQSMIFLSFFVFIPSILFSMGKFFFFSHETITDVRGVLLTSLTIYILIRITYFMRKIYVKINNPIFIFITSFVFLSFLGSLFLMLPSSTVKKISFIDALFTSTSAVCVTGLGVLDTSKDFTYLGKIIILTLIELGGLGILTVTSFFSYFFRDGFSFREGVYISNFLNTKTTNNVLFLAVKVVLLTLIVEIVGTLLIYLSIKNERSIIEYDSPLFFSIFHSISAFCNGGFSTLNRGFYSESVRFNYLFQFIIACLLILGGIGFNILFNFFTYIWLTLKKYFYKIFKDEYFRCPVHIFTLNTKIVLFTTFSLLFFGTIFYYISEYHYSLSEHSSIFGKWIISFFSSATSRTAGFQVLNMEKWTPLTILFTIFLMWIGASPASTGGGIKTSTFALALMNIISLSIGKDRLEIQKKEISSKSVRLAFAIIILSLIIIYISIFIILFLDPKKDILSISFEAFSAFSTVGLSLGITPNLSNGSKLVLITLMLLGRIGVFNIMIGLLKRNRINSSYYYQYPQGNILIN
ncbi:TrkH family potassium uptake protein [Blattabacterium sp. (Cryptocercus punctulatus) str. Cpu]|uniref:TrkH family potassium uptake protein n=1 Tax=Blattabacterium sp. (Cryptocercus punctulatus) str. Cpu TaxID=1075399 RepID=UPI00023871C4|nr:potassium transporter TrkG [Blattabacterium sp. (Cryptocercus punctulatus) str. Cpu]AEU09571.1 K uptake transporter subunit KtrB [Blattabacterium sp. (Cryptocercus punctulatus) str. Cpu]